MLFFFFITKCAFLLFSSVFLLWCIYIFGVKHLKSTYKIFFLVSAGSMMRSTYPLAAADETED